MYPNSFGVPSTVKAVAALFALSGGWQFVVKVLPAFQGGHPEALSRVFDVAIAALIVWGLLTLRRWARTLALLACAAGLLIPAVLLGGFVEQLGSTREIPDPAAAVRFLTVIGALSLLGLVLLMSPSARTAFRQ